MNIYNSLTRKTEVFKPINPPKVGIYACGPTVYDFVHIGNFRTYLLSDVLVRVLKYLGFKVNFYMNITDVGHLTGDNVGDADTGDDKMEIAAKKQNKNAWDIAAFYAKQFFDDYSKLNLTKPNDFVYATKHIAEQIDLIRKLHEKGFTYKTSDGIYFNTAKFPDYGKLSTLDKKGIAAGIRIDMREKKNTTDFALWKFSKPKDKRQMEWDSPWGKGFPGWHIECSAMSMKYLGESFDFHLGGEDLLSTHHPNEIAQSEAATGRKFVKYWIHGTFMRINNQRMSKSLKNNYTISDLEKKGFNPMALRYLYLTAHYRQVLNFTFDSLNSASSAFKSLNEQVNVLRRQASRNELSPEKLEKIDIFQKNFRAALEDDLNMPKTLAILWEVIKSNIPSEDKYDLIMNFNEVFGFKFNDVKLIVPAEVTQLADLRVKARKEGNYKDADKLREDIRKKGFEIEDKDDNYFIRKKN
ncbi:MAG: cysteine--tRNA ligase [Patescibacteria group bacterium]|nr:cysteine--tRNA ligase [Patescibacteria group bacterium]